MYYENKKMFYIKQYGLSVVLILIALVLIGTGIFLGLKNVDGDSLVETNAYVLSDQSFKGKVTAVSGLTITVVSDNISYNIDLIGIKENKHFDSLSSKISEDLLDKIVYVDYDVQKVERGKTYGYIFIDETLYNAKLLSSGCAELRTEKNNINRLDVLLEAELLAKHDGLGIWSY